MDSTTVYLVLRILCLSLRSVITASAQDQMINIQVLARGNDGQCLSMEERERARNRINRISTQVIASTCSRLGWRRVAFINMTATSYNCPIGLSLTSYSKRTCGQSHTVTTLTFGECSSTWSTFSVGGLTYSRVCGRIRGYQFGATSAFWRHT